MDDLTHVQRKIGENNDWYTGEQAASYDQYPLVTQRRLGFLFEVLADYQRHHPAKIKYCDLGCGDGYYLDAVIQKFRNIDFFATDYNPLRVERAQKKLRNVTLSRQNILNTNFPTAFFDFILFSQVLEHIREDQQALHEISRIISPSGIVLLGTPNEGCLMGRLQRNVIQPWIKEKTDHVNFYTEKVLTQMFKQAGLSVLQTMREHFLIPYTTIDTLLSAKPVAYRALLRLAKFWPSQAAGYYFVLKKSA